MNIKKLSVLAIAFICMISLPLVAIAANGGSANKAIIETQDPSVAGNVNPEIGGFGTVLFSCGDVGGMHIVCPFSIKADSVSGPITYLNAQVKYSDSYLDPYKYPVPVLMQIWEESENYVFSPGKYTATLSGTVTTLYAFNTIVPKTATVTVE